MTPALERSKFWDCEVLYLKPLPSQKNNFNPDMSVAFLQYLSGQSYVE